MGRADGSAWGEHKGERRGEGLAEAANERHLLSRSFGL